MKKIIAVIAVLALLVVGMAACSKTDEVVTPITTNEPAVVETYEVPVPAEMTEVETAN